jgi:Mrp family chromosome partitioning ATPase
MEKLQAALERARGARTERLAAPAIKQRALKAPAKMPATHFARWQALPSFEVKEDHLVQHRVVTRSAGAAATPFDILRTKTLLQMRQNGWKRLAITSPMPRSGKTTTACNLALGLSRQNDLHSMLFDLDLRDPSAHKFFEVEPPYSIGEVLSGSVPFEEQALRYSDNVIVSMAKYAEADPTRILLSEETVETLDAVEAAYEPDVMIFDLPSVLVNDDTRAFLKNVDCALIVTRADVTHYAHFDACKREIAEQTNVLGVVLNAYRYDKKGG